MVELSEIALIVVLLIFSFIYSGSEVSIFSISYVDKLKLSNEKSKKGRIFYHFVDRPTIALVTILVGNMVVNLTASIIGEDLSKRVFIKHPFFYSVFIMTFAIILFGEILPKNIAASMPVHFGKRFIKIIAATNRIFFPVIFILTKLIGKKESSNDSKKESLSTEELLSAIEVTSEVGLDNFSINILKNLVELIDKPVTELMIKRSDIKAFDINMKWNNLIDGVKTIPYSEVIFYQNNIDNIIGYVTKDIFISLKKKDLKSRIKEPLYIPESKSILNLLSDFKKNNEFLAIILDEYGGTAGLITIKDILDYIFVKDILIGTNIRKVSDKKWIVDGDTPISSFNNVFNLSLPTESNTIGGYLVNMIGKIPERGEEIFISENLKAIVNKSSKKQIDELEIIKID